MHPNEENIIVAPITKGVEIITSVLLCLISSMNIYYKENGGKKAFFANLKYQDRASQYGEHDLALITKRMEIITSIQVGLIS